MDQSSEEIQKQVKQERKTQKGLLMPNMYTDMRRVYRGLRIVGWCLLALPVGLTIYYTIYHTFFYGIQQ